MAVQEIAYSQDGINAGWIRRTDSSGDPTGGYLEIKGFNAANFAREVTTRTLLSNNTTYKETSKFSKYTGALTLVALQADMVEFFLPGELGVVGNVATFIEAIDSQPTPFALYLKSDAGGENEEAGAIGEFYPKCQVTNFSNPKTTGEYVSFEVTLTALAKDGSPRHLIFDSDTTVFNTTSDVTAPTISSTIPANDAIGVATSATPTATFSESMLESSLSGISLYAKATGVPVAVTIAYSDANPFVATVTPGSALSATTDYVLHVPTTVRDASGNYLAAAEFVDFTTT